MSRNKPYANWTRGELKDTLILHIDRMWLEPQLKSLWIAIVVEAIASEGWDVIDEYNGCTLVQDEFHPCPACFVHDYMWITGHGGYVSDNIFYHMMRAEGMKKSKAWRRWFAVRVGWYCAYMWKYIIRRKFMNPTPAMNALYNYFNNK